MSNKFNIKGAMQQFGAAMFVPVLLFSFSGLLVGLTIVLKNPMIMGDTIANPDGFFYKLLVIIEEGGWTIFRNMPLFFCIGIPIGLAKIAPERAVLATVICYLSFNYFIASILGFWGANFGVDYSQASGGVSGLTMIAGIKTLDTSILGGIVVGGIMTSIHNKYYEFRLPEYLGVFAGTSFIHLIGFWVMIPLAFLTCLVWPSVQQGINSLQDVFISSGSFGIWLYTFSERILIPTGLHHFIYIPFYYGPAVTENGVMATWLENVNIFVNSGLPLKEVFPEGGFGLFGNSNIFGSIGIALAIYMTAKKENKSKVAALLIPATLTVVITGISEPLEFTFLFVAPMLFVIHSLLAATLSTTLYLAGIVGSQVGGLINIISLNWLFTFNNYPELVIYHIIIGLSFTVLYYFIFKFCIEKWNLLTPGREDDNIKLYTKQEYKERLSKDKLSTDKLSLEDQALIFLQALGGAINIEQVTSCATRLRLIVKDPNLVGELSTFQEGNAHGLVKDGNTVQVIVGLSVPQVKTHFDKLLKQ